MKVHNTQIGFCTLIIYSAATISNFYEITSASYPAYNKSMLNL